jgi:hypothetical protein
LWGRAAVTNQRDDFDIDGVRRVLRGERDLSHPGIESALYRIVPCLAGDRRRNYGGPRQIGRSDAEFLVVLLAPAYPLINYEYAVITKKQPSPETAAALRSFLLWAIAPDETNARAPDSQLESRGF